MEDRDTVQSVPDDAKLEAKLAEMEARIVARLRAGSGSADGVFDSESETDATSGIANPLSGSGTEGDARDDDANKRLDDLSEDLFEATSHSVHLCTVAMCTDDAISPGRKALWVLLSFAVVVLQTAVCIAVTIGADRPSCMASSECAPGDLCREDMDGLRICRRCFGDEGHDLIIDEPCVLDEVTGIMNCEDTLDPVYILQDAKTFCQAANLTEIRNGVAACEACYDPLAAPTEFTTWNLGANENEVLFAVTGKMSGGDWLALFLTAMTVGLHVTGETTDIKKCEILARQRGVGSTWVNVALLCLQTLRQCTFLPLVVFTVGRLALWRGADAVSICFNAVAILFLLDLDDAVASHILPSPIQAYMRKSGQPTLGAEEDMLLATIKPLYTLLAAGFIVGGLVHSAVKGTDSGPWGAWYIPWIGAVFEAIVGGGRVLEGRTPKAVAYSLGKCVLGFWFFMGATGTLFTLGVIRK